MMNLLQDEILNKNRSITEKGALGYKSSGSALLDLNYAVSSLRQADDSKIVELFVKAFHEDNEYALKWLFFARDVREGLGERRLFRICYKLLLNLNKRAFYDNLKYISEYGRWDDVISLLGISEVTDNKIIELIDSQIASDLGCIMRNKSCSLLGKWLPSENASSIETKLLAKTVRKSLGLSSKEYRQLLSKLRRYIDVVEVKMCNNQWEDIDYEKVPSLANLKYKEAFLKHDADRRMDYLNSVRKGSSKMNMAVATPVDIVSKYLLNRFSFYQIKDYDETLELAWKNLKDISISDTLVVADGSGSMSIKVGGGRTTALDVANALAIYTSEHNNGVYKDKYITFSKTPQFVDFSNAKTLKHKLEIALSHNEISNTNIESVFDLILYVAVKNNIPSEEMIKNVLIISDMEFDRAQGWRDSNRLNPVLFELIKSKYENNGYKLPKLIFWNVNSRTRTIPILENDLGVTLVSGFSQNVLKMVMSNKYDAYEVLIETLDSERYNKIRI